MGTAAETAIGKTENNLTDDKVYFLSGAYVAATGVFTIAADGLGADTLIFQADAGADADSTDIGENTSFLVLQDVDSDDLHADKFVWSRTQKLAHSGPTLFTSARRFFFAWQTYTSQTNQISIHLIKEARREGNI